MPTDLPIACSLSADQQTSRLADMSALGQSALLSTETTGTQATLRFRPGRATQRRLAAIVEAEAECCAFLDMRLREQPGAIELTITAPTAAEPVLGELVAAFSGQASAGSVSDPQSQPPRTKSIFAVSALAMVLCCTVGPAVLGAATASLIEGWLGIVCAVGLTLIAVLALRARRGRRRLG